MAKAKRKKAYFGLDYLITLILAILPTNVVLGVVTRLMRENLLGAILNIVLFPIFYIVDLVTIILHKDVTFLA